MSNIVKPVDRNIPTFDRVQVFSNADTSAGDVILVQESLGRAAKSVTITCTAALVIKLNTLQKLYPRREHGGMMYPEAFPNVSLGVDYVADSPDISISPDTTTILDGPIKDITVVSAGGDFTFIVS